MLVKVDQAPFIRNFLAGLFTWLLLAGYVVFPGAFTSLRNAQAANELGKLGKTVLTEVQEGTLWVAAVCCAFAVLGMCWLWRKCRANHIWLEYHLFLQVFPLRYSKLDQLTFPRPGLRYSVVGLINSLVSIYTAHDGFWSVTAIVTTAVTGTCSVVMFVLYLVYEMHHLEARKEYDQERSHPSEQGS
jgi:hypothetical protein